MAIAATSAATPIDDAWTRFGFFMARDLLSDVRFNEPRNAQNSQQHQTDSAISACSAVDQPCSGLDVELADGPRVLRAVIQKRSRRIQLHIERLGRRQRARIP